MSVSSLLWVIGFLTLTCLSFMRKPVWSIALYMMIYFFFPYYWWWGYSLRIRGVRWSLLVGLVCIVVYLINRYGRPRINTGPIEVLFLKENLINFLLGAIVINYIFVHIVLAGGSDVSITLFGLGVKFILLFILMRAAIKSVDDFMLVLLCFIVGLGYLGYQVQMNGVGALVQGRLERIPLPSAETSNFLASMLVCLMPCLGAFFFFTKNTLYKLICLFFYPFIANLLFLCGSRSAFLGIIGAGLYLAVSARKKEWKILLVAIVLSISAAFALLGDVRIIDRFMTTFAAEEDRDQSAAGRLDLWQAGMKVLVDHPLGSGGDGFKGLHSLAYFGKYKAVHNGHLAYAINWGVQGSFLFYSLCLIIFFSCRSSSKYILNRKGLYQESFFGKAMMAGFVGFLIDGIFSNTLDDEWAIWMLALMYSYTKLVQEGQFNLEQKTDNPENFLKQT